MTPPASQHTVSHRWLVAAFALGLFGIVLGAKWAVASKYGIELGNWDQWDAEAALTIVPWFEGNPSKIAASFFVPQNEHRVVWTKMLAIAGVAINGQWDARMQCVINGTIHATMATLFWLWLRSALPGVASQAFLFASVVAFNAVPVSWENLIGGFHSQQIFLILFSLAAIAFAVNSPPGTRRWWAAMVCLVGAVFSMASGFFAAVPIAAVTLWQGLLERKWKGPVLTIGLMTAVTAAGFATRVIARHHDSLKADSVSEFLLSFWRSLQWPVIPHGFYGAIAWAPWCLLVLDLVRRRRLANAQVALGAMGGWVLLQYVAAAYARGADAAWPANRYLDTVAWGQLINAACCVYLFWGAGLGRGFRIAVAAIAMATIGFLHAPLRQHALNTFSDLKAQHDFRAEGEKATHAYLVTGDRAHLRASAYLPYPHPDDYVNRLAPASVRSVLPASVRPAIPLVQKDARNFSAGPFGGFLAPKTDATPADAAALPWRHYWGSSPAGAGPAEWSSQPVAAPKAGWLKFETAGDLGEGDLRLELRDARTTAPIATVVPTRIPRNTWRAAYVRAPSVPFTIVAIDRDPARWFAFSEPVEMPTLSYLAWRASSHGLLILSISAGFVALLLIIVVAGRAGLRRANP